MSRLIFFVCATWMLCCASVFAASNPANIPEVTSIAAMQALGVGSINYPAVNVASYYVGLNKGGGVFNWVAASTTATDGCTIFTASGVANGRWIRQVNSASLSLFDCGAKGDNSADDSASFQSLENAASAYGVVAIYPQGIFKLIATTITMKPGVVHQGEGIAYSGTTPLTHVVVSGMGTSQWCFDLQLPNGIENIEAPKFYNMLIDGCTNAIRFNNPAHGFTNDITTQQFMMRPYIVGVELTGTGTTGIGIQASKAFQGRIQDTAIVGGGFDTLIDLEGSDHFLISHNDLGGGQTQQVLLQAHASFGNDDIMNGNNRFVALANGGAAYITDNNRTSTIDNNFFEGVGTNACLISLSGGFVSYITNNDLSFAPGALTHWLCVTDTSTGLTGAGYVLIKATGNQLDGALTGASAFFNAGAGIAYYSSSGASRRLIIHNGNFQANGDIGFPMNSVATSFDSIQFQPQTVQLYSCDSDGLNFGVFGPTVLCKNGAFQLSSTGVGNLLPFSNTDRPQSKGAFDLWVLASSASAANINGCVTDAAVCTSAYAGVALTSLPSWVKVQNNQAVATSAGANIYSSNADEQLYAVAIQQH